MSNRLAKFVPSAETRIELLKLVHYEANRANLEPELVLAVIEVESHFDEFAISVAGARGLMQIMPFWLDEIGRPDDMTAKGSGIGLYMAQSIARIHKGRIEASSQGPGKGAVFTFSLTMP